MEFINSPITFFISSNSLQMRRTYFIVSDDSMWKFLFFKLKSKQIIIQRLFRKEEETNRIYPLDR